MARKKRQIQAVEPAGTNPGAPKPVYQDTFQDKVGHKVEDFGRQFEGKGKTLLYILLGIVVFAIVAGIVTSWSRKSGGAEQAALGRAIETSQAQVSASPQPAGSTTKTFKTEKERAEASVSEFQEVVDKYGSEKAKYFVAVNKLSLDRTSAMSELEALSKSSGEVGVLSKFALAQALESDGKTDEAIALYSEMASASNVVISKTTLNFRIASIYEKQGKKDEAANLYFEIAKTASEAKDSDGKAIPMTQSGREAKEKLQALNPEKAKEIKEEAPEMPSGMPPGF